MSLRGTKTGTVTLDEVRQHVISKTLADESVPREGLVLYDIIAHRIGNEHDVRPNDIEFLAGDFTMKGDGVPSAFAWDYEVYWIVYCDECGYDAVEQSDFSPNLCNLHYKEAWEQELADNDNDDRAVGIIQ